MLTPTKTHSTVPKKNSTVPTKHNPVPTKHTVPTKHRPPTCSSRMRQLAVRSLLMLPELAEETAEQHATTRSRTAPPIRLAVRCVGRRS